MTVMEMMRKKQVWKKMHDMMKETSNLPDKETQKKKLKLKKWQEMLMKKEKQVEMVQWLKKTD